MQVSDKSLYLLLFRGETTHCSIAARQLIDQSRRDNSLFNLSLSLIDQSLRDKIPFNRGSLIHHSSHANQHIKWDTEELSSCSAEAQEMVTISPLRMNRGLGFLTHSHCQRCKVKAMLEEDPEKRPNIFKVRLHLRVNKR